MHCTWWCPHNAISQSARGHCATCLHDPTCSHCAACLIGPVPGRQHYAQHVILGLVVAGPGWSNGHVNTSYITQPANVTVTSCDHFKLCASPHATITRMHSPFLLAACLHTALGTGTQLSLARAHIKGVLYHQLVNTPHHAPSNFSGQLA